MRIYQIEEVEEIDDEEFPSIIRETIYISENKEKALAHLEYIRQPLPGQKFTSLKYCMYTWKNGICLGVTSE